LKLLSPTSEWAFDEEIDNADDHTAIIQANETVILRFPAHRPELLRICSFTNIVFPSSALRRWCYGWCNCFDPDRCRPCSANPNT
jgi:hypothetical protein